MGRKQALGRPGHPPVASQEVLPNCPSVQSPIDGAARGRGWLYGQEGIRRWQGSDCTQTGTYLILGLWMRLGSGCWGGV